MKNFKALRTLRLALALPLFSVFFFLPAVTLAQVPTDTESIDAYKVNITVNPDSSIKVVEDIDYNFHTLQKHGIIRHLPVSYDAGGYRRNISITDTDATIDGGEYVGLETSTQGGNFIFKI